MKAVALIPARLAASRFPNKMLARIKGRTVIRRTYEATLKTGLFAAVVVVTDSDEIMAEITKIRGTAVKSKREYESGTDRIAEVAADMDADVFVNVQGDSPFVQAAPMAALLDVFRQPDGASVQVGSLVRELKEAALIDDPNFVKVALDIRGNALYFSRSRIPYPRDRNSGATWYEHIGVYAFRKAALMQFTQWPVTPLEAAEKIECLRFLEHGIPLRMVVTTHKGVEIDMPEDIARAEALMEEKGWE